MKTIRHWNKTMFVLAVCLCVFYPFFVFSRFIRHVNGGFDLILVPNNSMLYELFRLAYCWFSVGCVG